MATANMVVGGVDELLTRTDTAVASGAIRDGLGSVIALTDSAGSLQSQYSYEPFGKTTASGASNTNPSQYTGRENDGTGLYYYRARYYSPSLQRFISEDPIGFLGGDTNLYAYVLNSPTNYTDSTGTAIDTLLDIAFIAHDIYNIATGSRKDLALNALMLGADVLAAFIPGVTGAGQGVKLFYAGNKKAVQAALHAPRTPTDRLTQHTTTHDLTFCSREVAGTRAGTTHIQEVREAARGLRRRINQLKDALSNPKLTPEQISNLIKELRKASKNLDAAEQALKGRWPQHDR